MATSQGAPTVLRAGEFAKPAPITALKDKSTKTFYHMTPGAQFIMPDGLVVQFLGGQFTTDDVDIIEELDKIANKASSMIYTKQEAVNVINAETSKLAQTAVQTAATVSADAATTGVKAAPR